MLIKSDQSLLVLIDVQDRLMPAISHGQAVTRRCIQLAQIAQLLDVPVIATEQLPEKLGHNSEQIRELADVTVSKYHFDACPDGLVDEMPEGRQHIVIAGCETHVCMMQTALSLLDAGYKVWAVSDATGSRDDGDRDVALERLKQSGARVVTVEMVAFEWMIHCRHPRFREVQSLIK